MTPQELHAALDARRRALRLPWWRVAIDLDITESNLHAMAGGRLSRPLRARAIAWLES